MWSETVSDAGGRPVPFPACDPGTRRRRLSATGPGLSGKSADSGRRQDADHRQGAGNFFHVGLIRLILPNARIIHTMRDPVDTCVSCFSTLFTHGQTFSYDLAELGRYYRWYHELMDHWRSVLPAGAMLDVSYEEVVDDLEAASPAADRLLRPALGRSLPELSRNQPADHEPPATFRSAGRSTAARWRAGAVTKLISSRCWPSCTRRPESDGHGQE